MGKMQKIHWILVFLGVLLMGECLFAPTPTWAATDWELYQKEGLKSNSWDKLVQAGFETETQGSAATSYVFLRKAYELGCRDALVLMKLGFYYELKQNFKEALPLFSEASVKFEQQYKDHPLQTEADAHAARLAYQLQLFDISRKFAEQALILKPNDFGLLFLAGQLQRQAGKLPEAKQRFEQAMQVGAPAELGFDAQVTMLRELIVITAQLEDDQACLKYAEELARKVPGDQLAEKHRQRILMKRLEQQEKQRLREIIGSSPL